MSDSFFIDVIIIVLIQAILLYIYNIIVNKYKDEHDPLFAKIEVVKAILESTKHDKILSLESIREIELNAKEVYVFSKDMFRDVKNNGQFSKDAYNVGTFYPTVKYNLENTKIHYTYFIKEDSHWKHFIHSFSDSYKSIKNIDNKVDFHMISGNKYFFYDEIYLYLNKYDNYVAFEFLPSISNEKEQMLFYLELGSNQVDRLKIIKNNLIKKYTKKSLSDLIKKKK